jgi:hypothetical protein
MITYPRAPQTINSQSILKIKIIIGIKIKVIKEKNRKLLSFKKLTNSK